MTAEKTGVDWSCQHHFSESPTRIRRIQFIPRPLRSGARGTRRQSCLILLASKQSAVCFQSATMSHDKATVIHHRTGQ
jgi:hypothetical protein